MFGDLYIVKPLTENQKLQREVFFFEYIGIITFLLILINVSRSRTIFYSEAHHLVIRNYFFHRAETQGKIKKINWNDLDEILRYSPYENIKTITDNYFSNQRCSKGLIFLLESFFQSVSVRDAYKKTFALKLYEIFRPNLIVRHLFVQHRELHTIYCVPKEHVSGKYAFSAINNEIPDGCRLVIPWEFRIAGALVNLLKKIGILGMLSVFPLWVLIKVGIPSSKQNEIKNFSIGIRIYKTDLAFFQKYRSIDFLIDGKEIHEGNTLFCKETEISQDYQKNLENRGYFCVDMKSILHHADLAFVKNIILKKYFPLWFNASILSVPESPSSIMMTLETIHTGLIWELFCRKYHCNHYIVYNDMIPKQIIRNIVLEKNQINTCIFVFSCNSPDLYTPKGVKEFHHAFFCYLNYRAFISWGNKVTRYYCAHPNTIGSFIEVGCLWSESIMNIKSLNLKNESAEQVKKEIIKKNKTYPEKTIAVFDTTFGGDTILKSEDILGFLHGILQLIDDHPEYAMIYKMKIPWGYHITISPEIKKYYMLLSNHPRCVLLNGFDIEPSEVIAAADLTISACFTSSTVEAWGARIPAIFYDATKKFKEYYFDGFPKLVAHDYRELENLVKYWLDDVKESEREAYLSQWITPEIDKFSDGKALTRFRKYLSSTEKQRILTDLK